MTQPPDEKQASAWPSFDILVFGYFGAKTPDGKRFRDRTMTVGFVLGLIFAIPIPPGPPIPLLVALSILPGLAFAYVGWEWWRYLNGLDELARRMQFEAAAWTYIVGLAAAMLVGGFCYVMHWNFNPGLFYVLLEPIRTSRLWVLSRRY